MIPATTVDANRLRNELEAAVRDLYTRESSLLDESAHEQNLMFHIGSYLKYAVRGWSDPWDIDLELAKPPQAPRMLWHDTYLGGPLRLAVDTPAPTPMWHSDGRGS